MHGPDGPEYLNPHLFDRVEPHKQLVYTNTDKGASLEDPAGLFNSSLEGNARRASRTPLFVP